MKSILIASLSYLSTEKIIMNKGLGTYEKKKQKLTKVNYLCQCLHKKIQFFFVSFLNDNIFHDGSLHNEKFL